MKTFKKGETEIKIDKPIKQSGEPVYKTNFGDFTIADLQSQGFTETDSLDDTNTPINSSELEAQSAIEEDISQSQDIIGNKQKLKTNIETSLVKAGEGALANKEFIDAVAKYTEGRPATEEEIQKIGSKEGEGFGLVDAGVNDVLRRFGVAEDFGVLLEPAQAAQGEAQADTQTGTGGGGVTPIEEARDERKDTYEKIADLYRNIKGGLEDIKDETFKEERTALSEAETKLQDTKTELEQMKIMDIKEMEDLKDEPISNAAIRGEMSELSFDQEIDVMMKQQDYNNALVKKSLAQNDLTRARDIIQQTANDYYDNALLELEALEVEGKYQTSVIERLRNAALEERTFRLNGWTPIDPEQLDTKILEYSKQSGEVPETFTDPVTGQTYIRPRDTEVKTSNWDYTRIGTDKDDNPIYGFVNADTQEITTETPAEMLNISVNDIANTIKEIESRGNYNAEGASGEFGAYQFMPDTWNSWSSDYAKEVLKMSIAQLDQTPVNQDAVAKWKIQQWLDNGLTPQQIAAKWNSGSEVGWENKIGTNSQGVDYNVPAYVNKFMNTLKKQTTPEPDDDLNDFDVATQYVQDNPDKTASQLKNDLLSGVSSGQLDLNVTEINSIVNQKEEEVKQEKEQVETFTKEWWEDKWEKADEAGQMTDFYIEKWQESGIKSEVVIKGLGFKGLDKDEIYDKITAYYDKDELNEKAEEEGFGIWGRGARKQIKDYIDSLIQ